MKKIILFIFLTFNMFCFSKSYSTAEKKEILRQFQLFQKDLEKGNPKLIEKYIQFPLFSVSSGKINKEEFQLYNYESLKFLPMLKVNPDTQEITPVIEYLIEENEYGNTYLYIGADFIEKNNSNTNFIYEMLENYNGNGFLVINTESDEIVDGAVYLIFDLVKGKLKLTNIFYLP